MNKAMCLHCGSTIESVSTNDFVTCACFANTEDNTGIFLDGGDSYSRYGGCVENLVWVDEEGESC